MLYMEEGELIEFKKIIGSQKKVSYFALVHFFINICNTKKKGFYQRTIEMWDSKSLVKKSAIHFYSFKEKKTHIRLKQSFYIIFFRLTSL